MRIYGFESAVRENRVAISISIPRGHTLPATGRVAYTSPCGDDFLIGLELLEFTPADASIWARYIASLDDPHPAH